MQKINIAVFGGSFDPPHNGHVQIVKKALSSLEIDKFFIIPTFLNPFKKGFFAPAELRYKWLKKIFYDYKKVSVLDFEMKQQSAIATIKTVKYLYKNYNINTLYLIIGADNLAKLTSWQDYNELKKLVIFIIASRDNIHIPKDLINLQISANISSTKLRQTLNKDFLPASVQKEIIKFYKGNNE